MPTCDVIWNYSENIGKFLHIRSSLNFLLHFLPRMSNGGLHSADDRDSPAPPRSKALIHVVEYPNPAIPVWLEFGPYAECTRHPLLRLGARAVQGRCGNCGCLDLTLMLLDRFNCAFCQTFNCCVSGGKPTFRVHREWRSFSREHQTASSRVARRRDISQNTGRARGLNES